MTEMVGKPFIYGQWQFSRIMNRISSHSWNFEEHIKKMEKIHLYGENVHVNAGHPIFSIFKLKRKRFCDDSYFHINKMARIAQMALDNPKMAYILKSF